MYGINNVHSYCDTGMSAGYHSMAVFRLLEIETQESFYTPDTSFLSDIVVCATYGQSTVQNLIFIVCKPAG